MFFPPGLVSVQLGNGDGSFQSPEYFEVESGPSVIAVGDFNGDSKLDLAVAISGQGNLTDVANLNAVSVLLGNGDGTFQDQQLFNVGNQPDGIAVGDFSGDGKLDLAVAQGSGDLISLLMGYGDGTFQSPKHYAVGTGPGAIAVGDFNGDGKLDLVVANADDDTVSVLLGNADGTLQSPQINAVGNLPGATAVGDFNGDGKLDLAVANADDDTVSVLLGIGDGTFQAPQIFGAGGLPNLYNSSSSAAIAVGDFNGDGKLDLAVANGGDGAVSVLLGIGDGTFQAPMSYAAGKYPFGNLDAITVGDFNGDDKLDLAVADGGSGTVSVLLGNGDGSFQSQQTFSVGSGPGAIAVGDFNGDDKLDLAVADGGSSTVSVLLGNGDGSFQSQQTFSVGSGPGAIAVGDFNGDDKLDLAVTDPGANTVCVLLGNGGGSFQGPKTYDVGFSPGAITVGDFNGDDELDLAVTDPGANTVFLLLGNGKGTFQKQQTQAVGNDPDGIAVGGFQRRRQTGFRRRQCRRGHGFGAAGQRRWHFPDRLRDGQFGARRPGAGELQQSHGARLPHPQRRWHHPLSTGHPHGTRHLRPAHPRQSGQRPGPRFRPRRHQPGNADRRH